MKVRRQHQNPDRLLATPRARRAFEEEVLFGQVREQVLTLLDRHHLQQRDLAQRMGVSEGRISQVLSGAENLTLKTLGSIGNALGYRFRIVSESIDNTETSLSALLRDSEPAPAAVRRTHIAMPEAGRLTSNSDKRVRLRQQ